MKQEWVVIAHNIRSAYNVGGIFRTADGAGASKVYLTGYTPEPARVGALYRTPAQKMIAKTALGAEMSLAWEKCRDLSRLMDWLRRGGYVVAALEQNERSMPYDRYEPEKKTAIILGNEPRGIDRRVLQKCDVILEIPMHGSKNSLNVVTALGVAGYQISKKLKV